MTFLLPHSSCGESETQLAEHKLLFEPPVNLAAQEACVGLDLVPRNFEVVPLVLRLIDSKAILQIFDAIGRRLDHPSLRCLFSFLASNG